MTAQSSIRIIGGKWRSRKVSFKTKEQLRPTPDRVRETLFNWLAPYIVGANCLDLYAGSGVLGLEALSRGAATATAVENDRDHVLSIQQNAEVLQAHDLKIVQQNVQEFLQQESQTVDIVFVDPPYKKNLLFATLNSLQQNGWLHTGSFVYFEDDKPIALVQLPAGWQLWRESKAGHVYFYLGNKA